MVALLGGSVASGALLLGGAAVGAGIRAGWDLRSGSERQLRLERRTVLVSLLVRVALAFQLLLLFLLVFTADALAPQFTGAMCAAGSLRAAPYGYPALLTGLPGRLPLRPLARARPRRPASATTTRCSA